MAHAIKGASRNSTLPLLALGVGLGRAKSPLKFRPGDMCAARAGRMFVGPEDGPRAAARLWWRTRHE